MERSEGSTLVSATESFVQCRDFLLKHRDDYSAACARFRWPVQDHFNCALDYFDHLARNNHETALLVTDDAGNAQRLSFAELSERSNRVANWLRSLGVRRRDRMLVQLSSIAPLWEIMLAA